MIHASLFSGIGGFDYAAELMGWENLFHCEWNSFGQQVLKYYFPNSISYNDITKTDFTIHRGSVDILTGGFPCQPYSQAGKRLGKEDERHLWPEMLRAIREIKPTWVVGENVLGLVNWNGGMVFDEVQADLEAEGYEVQPYVLPACAVNAPHRRDRVWFVAYSNSFSNRRKSKQSQNSHNGERNSKTNSRKRNNREFESICNFEVSGFNSDTSSQPGEWLRLEQREHCESQQRELGRDSCKLGGEGDATNTSDRGMERYRGSCQKREFKTNEFDKNNSQRQPRMDWEEFPTQSPICNGDDGLSSRLDIAAIFNGKLPRKGSGFGKWRNESIKAGGNAIVPQVALQIFKAIEKYNKLSI